MDSSSSINAPPLRLTLSAECQRRLYTTGRQMRYAPPRYPFISRLWKIRPAWKRALPTAELVSLCTPYVLNYELSSGRSDCRRDKAVGRDNGRTVIPPQAGCGPSPTERGRDPADGGGDSDGEGGLLRDKPAREP